MTGWADEGFAFETSPARSKPRLLDGVSGSREGTPAALGALLFALSFSSSAIRSTRIRRVPMSKIRSILEARQKPAAPLDTPPIFPDQPRCAPSPRPSTVCLADAFALYREDQELPLARQRPALPRLPSAARRASAEQIFATHRRSSPSACARSAALRCARSATSPGIRALKDNDARRSSRPNDMLRELVADNKTMAARHAQGARALRRARRCGDHCGLLETLHRRHRAAHVVPVRGQPRSRRFRPLTRSLLPVDILPPRSDLTVERWRLASARR